MRTNRLKNTLGKRVIDCGVIFLFLCVYIGPAVGDSSQHSVALSTHIGTEHRNDGGDIPTWSTGDQWVYTVSPLSVSGPNGSFSGAIQNFKQKVLGITDGWYTVDITGQISGQLIINGVPGQLSGQIMGTSLLRVSDLAEGTTELHSQGTITMMFVPFPYQLHLVTSSAPPLELYDFPLSVGEQWQLSCLNSISGFFSIEGVYEQSFEGGQWIDETVTCVQMKSINVPAGTFDCYEIGRSRSENEAWYSTEVGNIVKSVVNQSADNMSLHLVLSLQSVTPATQSITVTEEITPAMVAPGVSVVVSGQAFFSGSGSPVQNGVVSIQIPSTGGSWSTTTDSAGYYSKVIVAPTMVDDTISGRETGSGGVLVHCSSGSIFGYRVRTLTTVYDTPPEAPSISGPTTGKIGVTYTYTFISADPESDAVFYYVDWGDGTNSSWVGPSPSSEDVILSHTFTKKGSYTIKAQARDMFYAESDWGSLEVSMPKDTRSLLHIKVFERFPFLSSVLHYLLSELRLF